MKLTRVPLVETSPASLRFATGAGSEIKILSSSGSHKSKSSGAGSAIFKKKQWFRKYQAFGSVSSFFPSPSNHTHDSGLCVVWNILLHLKIWVETFTVCNNHQQSALCKRVIMLRRRNGSGLDLACRKRRPAPFSTKYIFGKTTSTQAISLAWILSLLSNQH